MITIVVSISLAITVVFIILDEWKKHRQWKAAKAERDRVYQFWCAQCRKSLNGLANARSEDDYARWNEAMRVNMRRYAKEVLGK